MASDPRGLDSVQVKKADVERVFRKLDLEIRSTGHHYGWLIVHGKKVLRVHYSHGKGDVPRRVVDRIRGQLKLGQSDFRDLLSCPLAREGYLKILRAKRLVD